MRHAMDRHRPGRSPTWAALAALAAGLLAASGASPGVAQEAPDAPASAPPGEPPETTAPPADAPPAGAPPAGAPAAAAGAPEPPLAPAASAPPLEGRVVYQTADGVYIDLGAADGLAEGQEGWLEGPGGARIARVRVGKVADGSAFLGFLADAALPPAVGDAVALALDGARPAPRAPGPPAGADAPRSPSLKQGDEGFVPLLAPPDLGSRAATEAKNVFHGRLTLHQAVQVATDEIATADGDLDWARTRLRFTGSVDRIDQTPWSLEWSAELSYRTGDGLERARDHDKLRLEVHRLALFRRFDDRSFVRIGRFLPRELPGVGFLDGAHGEVSLAGDRVRLGAMAGFKPTLHRLTPTADEPAAAAYATLNLGEQDGLRYFGTLGVLGTLYEGDPDRLAVLLDQRIDWGPVSLLSSSEVDLDVDQDDVREGTRLTRWSLLASWTVIPEVTLSAGLDRFEVPDTGAERDALRGQGALPDDAFFEGYGYWRWFARAAVRLPVEVTVAGEVGFVEARDEDDVRWSVSVTRTGLPLAEAGSITLSVYNLRAGTADGYGARLSAALPMLEHRLVLQPGVTFRFVTHDTEGARFFDPIDEDLAVVDVSLRAHWRLSRSWTLFGGVDYGRVDGNDRFLVDVGVTWWW